MNKVIETKVDEDILHFLKTVYFGDYTDPLKAASSRAYLDMNRTIRFNGLSDDTRLILRKEVYNIFKTEISKLTSDNITSQDDFNDWHLNVCNMIKKKYSDKGITLTYGHAQKWINMTIKYLYMLGANNFDDVFEFLHIPLDNYIIDIARNSLGIKRLEVAWSRCDDYKGRYLPYQKQIREKITTEPPLRWEFRHWQKSRTK